MTDRQPDNERGWDPSVSRGTLLRGTAAAAIGAMAVPGLALGAERATAPNKGGTLRAGFVGGGTAETLNPYLGVTPIDESRIQNLYDPLVRRQRRPHAQPRVSRWSGMHNKDATVYEVKLRQGVTFHNGKTFGAEDVIWSIRQMAGKTSAALPFVSGIRLGELKAINKLTVRIPLKSAGRRSRRATSRTTTPGSCPRARRPRTTRSRSASGPFMAQTFTPGRQSVFTGQPELLGQRQALRRLAQDRLDRRQHGAPQRAALGPDRRHGAAAHTAGQGTRGDGRHQSSWWPRRRRR